MFVRTGFFAQVAAIDQSKTPRRRSRRLTRLSRFELMTIVIVVVVGVGVLLTLLIVAAQPWK